MQSSSQLVTQAAQAAAAAAPSLASASDEKIDEVLQGVAALATARQSTIVAANQEDVAAARRRLPLGTLDRLRLDERRLELMAQEIGSLAELPHVGRAAQRYRSDRTGEDLEITERRIPIGVVGAIYEARGAVTVDIASQLIKSRNAGVLRSGSAVLGTASTLMDTVISPALDQAGMPSEAIQLLRSDDHNSAEALVTIPQLVPVVVIRGSGPTTAKLSRLAAAHGVHALAHAEGGGVMYVHPSADRDLALGLIEKSLDRLGVCNRLNLLLLDARIWDEFLPSAQKKLDELGIAASLPPHDHPLGHEWASDPDRQATVTIAAAEGPAAAAALANAETPGIAACVAAEDAAVAQEFLDLFSGTGAFWNVPTRLLDGFKLTGAPETGINVARAVAPRGPVTYRDLYLRQYLVTRGEQNL